MIYQGSHLPSIEGFLPSKFDMYPQNLQTFLYKPIHRGSYKTEKISHFTPHLQHSVGTLSMHFPDCTNHK